VITVSNHLAHIITRIYDEASFAYNVRTGAAVFIEGTVAQLLPAILENDDALVRAFLDSVPSEWKTVAEGDVADAYSKIADVLESKETVEAGEYFATNEDAPLAMLGRYAVKKWQPVNVTVELTYRCNLDCRYCYLDDHSLPGLTSRKLLDVGHELKEAGAAFVLFTGGETFLRPDALEIMQGYKDLGFGLEAKSNALLIDQLMIRRISELELFNLQISVYGFEDGVSPVTGGFYDFSKLRYNIQGLVEAGVPVTLSVIVGKHNITDLPKYESALKDLGVIEVSYSPFLTPRRDGDKTVTELRLSRQEMEAQLKPFILKNGGFVKPTKYRNRECGGPICYAGRDQLAIDPSGNVHPCLDFRLPMGNLLESDLVGILANREAFLRPFKLGKVQKCMDCSIVEYCDSCPGASLLEYGDYVAPVTHKCDVSRFYWDATHEGGD
jgi:radical SAM protein with 4Fe4S-binding SPASM domain